MGRIQVREGAEIVVTVGGRPSKLATATYCDCGALCVVNAVHIVSGDMYGMLHVPGPLSEIGVTEDDKSECDACA